MQKYPELDKIVREIADHTSEEINRRVKDIKSEMPYRQQYVLEEVIEILQGRV